MRAYELIEQSIPYYHGSHDNLPIGTILSPRDSYEDDWGKASFYHMLEVFRSDNMLAHKEAVFMVDNTEDIDLAGGATDYVFILRPLGRIERHDLNWGSEISSLVDQGYDEFSEEVSIAAKNYWNGTPHPNESVWEYLTPKAEILSVEPF